MKLKFVSYVSLRIRWIVFCKSFFIRLVDRLFFNLRLIGKNCFVMLGVKLKVVKGVLIKEVSLKCCLGLKCEVFDGCFSNVLFKKSEIFI